MCVFDRKNWISFFSFPYFRVLPFRRVSRVSAQRGVQPENHNFRPLSTPMQAFCLLDAYFCFLYSMNQAGYFSIALPGAEPGFKLRWGGVPGLKTAPFALEGWGGGVVHNSFWLLKYRPVWLRSLKGTKSTATRRWSGGSLPVRAHQADFRGFIRISFL